MKKKIRIAVFIDAANVLYSQKTLGWQVDYKRLIEWLELTYQPFFVGFYYGVVESNLGQKKFFEMLRDRGYVLVTKPVKFIKSGKEIIKKGNLDVEIAYDILRLRRQFDICVLMSGDSDFEIILKDLKERQKQVIVFSTRGHVARELIKWADKYVPFEKIRKQIERKNHPDARSGDVYSKKILNRKKRKVNGKQR